LEVLLLQAALFERERAAAAWSRFCDSVPDIEALNVGCYHLFPLIAANLGKPRNEMPHGGRLAGTLRYSWAKNQQLMDRIVPRLRSLQSAGLGFLMLKGAALVSVYREKGGTRPMADVDILIRPHDLPQVMAILAAHDCHPPKALTTEYLSELIRFRHELTFQTSEGESLDVHWYLVSDSWDLEAEDAFWEDSVPCALPNLSARTLHPSDQLLHTCLHGTQWNEVSPVRWLADATMLIRAGVDWERLEAQGRRLRQLGPVRDTLLFLNDMEIELPPGVAEHWRGMKLAKIETIESGYKTQRPNPRERTRQLAWVYFRMSRHMSLGGFIRNLPGYMAQIHHFRSYSRRVRFLAYLTFLTLTGRRAQL
jgi:hypothetical protein